MNKSQLTFMFCVVSGILIAFGFIYVFFGLKVLPVARDVLLPWESALYGAVMMGWGTTLLFAGRIAFKRNDVELKQALLFGLVVWLLVEAAASVWFGVWFNVGVDAAVFGLFAWPLLKAQEHTD